MSVKTKPLPTEQDAISDAIAIRDGENADYVADWATKYAPQVKALNEMIGKDGLWSEKLRLF